MKFYAALAIYFCTATQVLLQSGAHGAAVTLAAAASTAQNETLSLDSGSYRSLATAVAELDDSEQCEMPANADSLTQTQLIERLTDPCRYDRLEPPSTGCKRGNVTRPSCQVVVSARVYIYVLQNVDSSDLKFHIQGLMQVRFVDTRLAFDSYAPSRKLPIMGEAQLRELIWVPHIFLSNEHDSSVLGTSEKDVLVSIAADGTVIISSRIQATLYCWMNLRKFPFDEQRCSTVLESWMYNASEMMLHWETIGPVSFDPQMHLTEYVLQSSWCNESLVVADLEDMRHGAFVGNYSSLSFTVHLTRETGYYVMDYFLPSMMIVAISWVSFWLQADQTPARTTLGTSTLLSFITLASSQESNLPKVSYIKVSEVWFLGCTIFIFGSLIEFAFVNTIWRRSRSLELKKVNSKYIFKSTLTPNMNRRKPSMEKSVGAPHFTQRQLSVNRFLAIEPPIIVTEAASNCSSNSAVVIDDDSLDGSSLDGSKGGGTKDEMDENKPHTWFTMTPHEVALWIDRKARFVFPLMFMIFNAIFWTFVYCL